MDADSSPYTSEQNRTLNSALSRGEGQPPVDFIFDHRWQMFFLVALIAWTLLLCREAYRFRTLASQFRLLFIVLAGVAFASWATMFFAMWVATGIVSAIISYVVFLVLAAAILAFTKRRRYHLLHPESLAQTTWENAVVDATIERAASRPEVKMLLSDFSQDPAFLRARAEQLRALGHDNLVRRLEQPSYLREVLQIYSRGDWSDLDKIVAAINCLSGRSSGGCARSEEEPAT